MIISEDINADSIKKIICDPIEAAPKYPMDEETTGILVKLLFSGQINPVIKDSEKPFLYQLIEKRLSLFNFTIRDTRLIVFLMIISRSPGVAVMYLWYLQYWAKNIILRISLLRDFAKSFLLVFQIKKPFKKYGIAKKLKEKVKLVLII